MWIPVIAELGRVFVFLLLKIFFCKQRFKIVGFPPGHTQLSRAVHAFNIQQGDTELHLVSRVKNVTGKQGTLFREQ